MRVSCPGGHYEFLPDGPTFSGGVVAAAGTALVHVIFREPLPLRAAFEAIEAHLRGLGCPMRALCALELRSPEVRSWDSFNAFNREYVRLLDHHDLRPGGQSPITRTNIVPARDAARPGEPSVYAFTHTVPERAPRPQFVTAGLGDLRGGEDPFEARRVHPGETGPEGLRAKARFVMDALDDTLRALGATWSDATRVNVYSVYPLWGVLDAEVLARVGRAAVHGLHVYPDRPPIAGIDFEMDVRGVAREVYT